MTLAGFKRARRWSRGSATFADRSRHHQGRAISAQRLSPSPGLRCRSAQSLPRSWPDLIIGRNLEMLALQPRQGAVCRRHADCLRMPGYPPPAARPQRHRQGHARRRAAARPTHRALMTAPRPSCGVFRALPAVSRTGRALPNKVLADRRGRGEALQMAARRRRTLEDRLVWGCDAASRWNSWPSRADGRRRFEVVARPSGLFLVQRDFGGFKPGRMSNLPAPTATLRSGRDLRRGAFAGRSISSEV